jgi:presenilin-like A22 family membrane protease
MKHEEKGFMIVLLIVTLSMFFMAFKYDGNAKVLPILSGIFSAYMMGFLVFMAFHTRLNAWYQKLEAATILSKVVLNADEKKRELSVAVWFAGCTGLIYLFGFVIGIPVFLFLFLKIWAKESWLLSIVLSAAVLGVIFFSFVSILRVPLHEGIFFS